MTGRFLTLGLKRLLVTVKLPARSKGGKTKEKIPYPSALHPQAHDLAAKAGIGEMLPPGGPGRGNKGSALSDPFTKQRIRECRAVAYNVPEIIFERYYSWIQHHSTDHLAFRDVLTLAKLGDLQEPVLAALETSKAETLAKAIRIVRHDEIVDGEADVAKGEYVNVVTDFPGGAAAAANFFVL